MTIVSLSSVTEIQYPKLTVSKENLNPENNYEMIRVSLSFVVFLTREG